MAAGDVTITRGIGARDDGITNSAWANTGTGSTSSDGDNIICTGLTTTNNYVQSTLGVNLSSSTYPGIMIRTKSTSGTLAAVQVNYNDSTNDYNTYTVNTSNYTVNIFTLTSGKTITSVRLLDGNGSTPSYNVDFVFFFKQQLTLPAVSQPLTMTLQRYIVELPIPTREGGVLQDMGSQSAMLDVSGTLITTGQYTGDQWWDVLVGTWLEANWQWLASDRVAGKYQIEQLMPAQDPGKVGFYGFKMRLRKVDVLSATSQSFASNTGTGAIQ